MAPAKTYSEKAQDYRNAVISARIRACKQIITLCKDIEADFASVSDEEYEYFYDVEAAHRVCKIIEAFKHVKGKLAAKGQHIHLEDWQCNWITTLYGWKRKRDGLRRYRRATVILPRKQGKSLIAAALAIYHLLFDGEQGAEVYCGASNLRQSKEVFSAAQQMLIGAQQLMSKLGVQVNAASIVCPQTNSKFEPVISRAKDGTNPSFAICDETHQMRDLTLYESFETGTAAREQPMILSISTAGAGTENPCKQLQDQAEKVLNKIVTDRELFILIYTIDPDVDWQSTTALEMANPGIDVSVTWEFLRQAQTGALNTPSKAASFKTKHLNVTVAAANAFFSVQRWESCEDKTLTIESFAGEPCYMAFDLSAKLDLTAIAMIFTKMIDTHVHFYVFTDCFAPEEAIEANPTYKQWAARGLLNATEGNTIDYTAIENLILSRCNDYKVLEIGYDSWHADFFVQNLQPKTPGKTVYIDIPQRATHMSAPMKYLEELTYNRRVHHNGDPLLKFAISNVTAKRFGNLISPDKAKPENKIDPAVAVMIALNRAMNVVLTPPPPKPFYAAVW